ncbi:hypothetical protein FQA47_005186 [Oryzias melastigma]|uniref:Uncharacterized protein n=1 Tax=Oryzias melastigma TaxID=30732 RepID=A0A834C107_ORYME|nr:hypothetical protein FQA47_005186 [Oryzias melastigma]
MDPQEKPQVLDPNMSEPSRESRDSGSPAAQIPERGKLKDRNQEEDLKDPPSEEEEDQDMEEEEKSPSALLEPSTLLWSGNLNRKILLEQNPDSEEAGEGEGSQVTDPSRWRESMPEGERWRDEVLKEDCWLADDEEEEDEDTEVKSGKPAAGFHSTHHGSDPGPEPRRDPGLPGEGGGSSRRARPGGAALPGGVGGGQQSLPV